MDRFINPGINLLMSTCFHLMCTDCMDRLFIVGRQTQCPQCQSVIKKHLFQLQLFEDISIEKDLKIRKRIEGIYNRRVEDFDNLLDYNNYIERKEQLIINLLTNEDVRNTEIEIKKYEIENKEEIRNNSYKELAQQQITKNKIQDGDQKRLERHSKYLQDTKREMAEQALEKEKLLQSVEMGMDLTKAMRDYEEKKNKQVVDPLESLIDTHNSFFSIELKRTSPYYLDFKKKWQSERCGNKNLEFQMEAGGFSESNVYIRASQELSSLFS